MPPHLAALLLQAAEATKLAADAGARATEAAAKGGESAPIAWFLFLLALIAMTILAVLYWKELKNKHEDMQKAAQVVREEAAREIALDAGHAEAMYQQAKAMYEGQIKTLTESNERSIRELRDMNQELRRQESKSIEVLGATGTTIRDMNGSLSQVISNQNVIISLLQSLGSLPRPLTPLAP